MAAFSSASRLLRLRPRGGRLVTDSATILKVYSRQQQLQQQQHQKMTMLDGQQQRRRRCVCSATSSSSASASKASSSSGHEKRKSGNDDDASSSSTPFHDNDANVEAQLDAHFRRVATAEAASVSSPATTTTAEAAAEAVGVPTYALPLIQWYPGHIARAERQLLEQLKLVDVVIEVRDARCPRATAHPTLDEWFATRPGKTRLLVVNREDMVSEADAAAWKKHLGANAIFCNAKTGKGTRRVLARALSAAEDINKARYARMVVEVTTSPRWTHSNTHTHVCVHMQFPVEWKLFHSLRWRDDSVYTPRKLCTFSIDVVQLYCVCVLMIMCTHVACTDAATNDDE